MGNAAAAAGAAHDPSDLSGSRAAVMLDSICHLGDLGCVFDLFHVNSGHVDFGARGAKRNLTLAANVIFEGIVVSTCQRVFYFVAIL